MVKIFERDLRKVCRMKLFRRGFTGIFEAYLPPSLHRVSKLNIAGVLFSRAASSGEEKLITLSADGSCALVSTSVCFPISLKTPRILMVTAERRRRFQNLQASSPNKLPQPMQIPQHGYMILRHDAMLDFLPPPSTIRGVRNTRQAKVARKPAMRLRPKNKGSSRHVRALQER